MISVLWNKDRSSIKNRVDPRMRCVYEIPLFPVCCCEKKRWQVFDLLQVRGLKKSYINEVQQRANSWGCHFQWHVKYKEPPLILMEKLPLISREVRFQCELGMALVSLICYCYSKSKNFHFRCSFGVSNLMIWVLKALHWVLMADCV